MTLLSKSACVLIGCAALLLGVAGSVSPARTGAWPPPLLAQASWTSSFSTGDFTEWSWWGQGQDDVWGHIDVTTHDQAGIPALSPALPHVARMTVTRRDAATGRTHAKLFKAFEVGDGDDARTPPDVSGTYSAWYYVPSSYRIGGDAYTNLFQFKEQYGERSDPLWWVQLGSARWARDYNGDKRWVGEPAGRNGVVAFVNHWHRSNWRRQVRFAAVPQDRWFEVRAELRQRRKIDFYLDGRLLATASADQYPVSPFRRDSRNWTFGVGNYSTAPGTTLYVGAASYRPGVASSRTSAAGTPSTAPDASSP